MGHFSAWDGAVSWRSRHPGCSATTEDMLNLVSGQAARGTASALGSPKWKVDRDGLFTARRSRGMVDSGVMLAVARSPGERRPPLYFHRASTNQFWSTNMKTGRWPICRSSSFSSDEPLRDWQVLAWGGALDDHDHSHVLNIGARAARPNVGTFKQ